MLTSILVYFIDLKCFKSKTAKTVTYLVDLCRITWPPDHNKATVFCFTYSNNSIEVFQIFSTFIAISNYNVQQKISFS